MMFPMNLMVTLSIPPWMFEGLAAGPSLEARTGIRGELIDQHSEVWDVQAYYIAQRLSKQQSFTVLKLSSLVAVLWGQRHASSCS